MTGQKLYFAGGLDEDGDFVLLGVFSTREKAQAAAERIMVERDWTNVDWSEITVDESYWDYEDVQDIQEKVGSKQEVSQT